MKQKSFFAYRLRILIVYLVLLLGLIAALPIFSLPFINTIQIVMGLSLGFLAQLITFCAIIIVALIIPGKANVPARYRRAWQSTPLRWWKIFLIVGLLLTAGGLFIAFVIGPRLAATADDAITPISVVIASVGMGRNPFSILLTYSLILGRI